MDGYRELKGSLIPEEERMAEKMNQLKGLADKIRQYEEVIDFEKAQLNVPGGLRHERVKPLFQLNLPDVSKDFLNEARFFPQDEDFDFNNDENERGIFGRPKFDDESNTKTSPNFEQETHHSMHAVKDEDDKSYTNEFAARRFKDIQILGDPADFAYAPPDARYYRKSDEAQRQQGKILFTIFFYFS